MSFLGRIFGSQDAIDKTISTVGGLFDEAFYTRQERHEDELQEVAHARAFIIEWLKTTSTSNLARRVIAFAITGVWLLMYLLGSLFEFAAVWAGVRKNQLIESAGLMDARADTMLPAVMLILGFYFAAPHMGKIATAALERFGKTGQARHSESKST